MADVGEIQVRGGSDYVEIRADVRGLATLAQLIHYAEITGSASIDDEPTGRTKIQIIRVDTGVIPHEGVG